MPGALADLAHTLRRPDRAAALMGLEELGQKQTAKKQTTLLQRGISWLMRPLALAPRLPPTSTLLTVCTNNEACQLCIIIMNVFIWRW